MENYCLREVSHHLFQNLLWSAENNFSVLIAVNEIKP